MHIEGAGFADVVVEKRENPSSFLVAKAPEQQEAKPLRQGYSPYMLERNRRLAAAKQAKGGKLTTAEIARVTSQFEEYWRAADRRVYQEAFNEWRAVPQEAAPMETAPYCPSWGGGCSCTPITKEEMCEYVKASGWPSQAEVLDSARQESRSLPAEGIDFDAYASYNMWGRGRATRNADRESSRAPEAFDVIEVGIMRYLMTLPRAASDAGDIMLLIDGPRHDGAGVLRVAVLITGVTYNPKVFEVTWQDFLYEEHSSAAVLPLPSMVRIASRACLASPSSEVINTQTSDEFILMCVNNMSRMQFHVAKYEPVLREESLLWARIDEVATLGVLWEPGMRGPWQPVDHGRPRQCRAVQALGQLVVDDPLSDGARRVVPRRPRGRGGRGRGRRGRMAAGRGAADHVAAVGVAEASDEDEGGDIFDDELYAELEGALLGPDDEAVVDPMPASDAQMPDPDDELRLTYACEATAPTGDAASSSAGGAGAGSLEEMDPATVAAVVAGVSSVDDCLPGGESAAAAGLAGGSRGEVAHVADAAAIDASADDDRPWERMTEVTPLGYVYMGGRSVLRIQRGRPTNSCTITCYMHGSCHALLGLARTPDDETIKKWLFEVPPAPEGATPAEAKALAKRHSQLLKDRYSAAAFKRAAASN